MLKRCGSETIKWYIKEYVRMAIDRHGAAIAPCGQEELKEQAYVAIIGFVQEHA